MNSETTIYSGFCPKCDGRMVRVWHGKPWRGSDGEGSFAQDCVACGPGVEVYMAPDGPEDADELVEASGIDLSVIGTTVIVEREAAS